MLLPPSVQHVKPMEENGWTFHPTGLEAFLRCPRKYYYSTVLGLTPKKSKIDLVFGSCMHTGVGYFYQTRAMSNEEAIEHFQIEVEDKSIGNFELAQLICCKSFAESWSLGGIEGNQKKNLSSGLESLGRYCVKYRNTQDKFKSNLIESRQMIAMPNGTTMSIGIDRVQWTDDDYISVVDTKSTGSNITDWYWKNFENSFQLLSYDYSVTAIIGHCDAVQIDAIKLPYTPPKAGEETSFQRKTWVLTDMQKEDWLTTYTNITNYIRKALRNPDEDSRLKKFNCNGTSCSDYGGCPFLCICKYGFSHPAVKDSFYIDGEEV